MPNRIIKESAFLSDKIACLSDFEFRLWVGLITQADDAGRGDARPAIIKGRVFALRESATAADISAALQALASHGCIVLYAVDGKPYYAFPTWSEHQRVRDVRSKYPPPDSPPQPAAHCGEPPPESESESETISESVSEQASPDRAFDSGKMQSAFEDWLSYKRERGEAYRETGRRALVSRLRADVAAHGEDNVIGAIRYSMAQGWKGIYAPKDQKSPAAGKASYDMEKAIEQMNTTVPEMRKRTQ